MVYTTAQLDYKSKEFSEAAFDAFYEEYYGRIYNYIYFRIKDTFTAEDLTGIVLEKALKNMRRYDETRTQISTWIFSIARNTLIDFYRLKSRKDVYFEEGAELTLPDEVSSGVEECVLEKEQSAVITKALECLSDREQEIVALKFWGGLRSREIAEQMGLDEGNVNVIVFRALKKLKKHMDENGISL